MKKGRIKEEFLNYLMGCYCTDKIVALDEFTTNVRHCCLVGGISQIPLFEDEFVLVDEFSGEYAYIKYYSGYCNCCETVYYYITFFDGDVSNDN